jgi:hypothetical protein
MLQNPVYLGDRSLEGCIRKSLSAIAPLVTPRHLHVLTADGTFNTVEVQPGEIIIFSTKLIHSGTKHTGENGVDYGKPEGETDYVGGDPAVFFYMDTEHNPHDNHSQVFVDDIPFQKFWHNCAVDGSSQKYPAGSINLARGRHEMKSLKPKTIMGKGIGVVEDDRDDTVVADHLRSKTAIKDDKFGSDGPTVKDAK